MVTSYQVQAGTECEINRMPRTLYKPDCVCQLNYSELYAVHRKCLKTRSWNLAFEAFYTVCRYTHTHCTKYTRITGSNLTPSSGRILKKSGTHQQPKLVLSIPTMPSMDGMRMSRGRTLVTQTHALRQENIVCLSMSTLLNKLSHQILKRRDNLIRKQLYG